MSALYRTGFAVVLPQNGQATRSVWAVDVIIVGKSPKSSTISAEFVGQVQRRSNGQRKVEVVQLLRQCVGEHAQHLPRGTACTV